MTSTQGVPASRLTLDAATAADLMSERVVSVHAGATVGQAVTLLVERGLSAAPVIAESGRPVGVVSRGDILIHTREEGTPRAGSTPSEVRDIMTPAVFSVTPETPVASVVVDHTQAVVGVVSVHDVLRRLRPR